MLRGNRSPRLPGFGLMLLVVFVAYVTVSLPYTLIVPTLAKAHPQGYSLLGCILGSYFIGQLIGAPIVGQWADDVGCKKILVITLLMASLGQLLSGYAMGMSFYLLLILSRFISGFAEGNIAIARSWLSAQQLPENEQQAHFGYLNAMMTLGWLIGPILGALLAKFPLYSSPSHSMPFYWGALLTCLTAMLVQHQTKAAEIKAPTNPKKPLPLTKLPRAIYQLFQHRRQANLLLIGFLLTLAIDVLYQFLPLLLTVRYHFRPDQLAYALAALALANALSNLMLVGRLSQHVSPNRIILGNTIILLVSIGGIGFIDNRLLLLSSLPLVGMAIALATSNLLALVANTSAATHQGKVMGIMLSLRTLGNLNIALIGAWLAHFSIHLPFGLSCVSLLLAGTLFAKSEIKKRT